MKTPWASKMKDIKKAIQSTKKWMIWKEQRSYTKTRRGQWCTYQRMHSSGDQSPAAKYCEGSGIMLRKWNFCKKVEWIFDVFDLFNYYMEQDWHLRSNANENSPQSCQRNSGCLRPSDWRQYLIKWWGKLGLEWDYRLTSSNKCCQS